VGLIEADAVVACSGVTECDQAINAATAIPAPIVPVDKNTLNMISPYQFLMGVIMSLSRFGMLSSFAQNDVVPISFVSWELLTFLIPAGDSNTGEDGISSYRAH
jgi:hypothetical protein